MDGLARAERVARGQDGVIGRGRALRAGLAPHEVDGLRRAGRWRSLARGAYFVASAAHPEPGRRAAIRAARLSLGRTALVVLDTAAELHGLPPAGAHRAAGTVHVAAPGRRPARAYPGIVVHQLAIPPAGRTRVGGIPATTPRWTLAALLPRLDRDAAVALLDAALYRGLLGPADLRALPALLAGRRGAVAARAALPLADGRAASPLETRLRLRCLEGRVPPEGLRVPVRDRGGRVVAHGALGWPSRRLIVDADEPVPGGAGDHRRHNRVVAAGWRLLRFSRADAAHPDAVARRVRTVLSD
ncbi:hypothetical protein [Pilimelia anulata]|nr:hypothetical protein [Pilimelia anulata]